MLNMMVTKAVVANFATYTPKHVKQDGTVVGARLSFAAFCNDRRATENPIVSFVAWGKLAEILARSIHKGKALDISSSRIQVWMKPSVNRNGDTFMTVDANGQSVPHRSPVTSFVVENFDFGADARKLIEHELQTGKRPPQWDVPGTQDYQAWGQTMDQRFRTVYNGGNMFYYCNVKLPNYPHTLQPENAKKASENAYGPGNGQNGGGAGGGGGYQQQGQGQGGYGQNNGGYGQNQQGQNNGGYDQYNNGQGNGGYGQNNGQGGGYQQQPVNTPPAPQNNGGYDQYNNGQNGGGYSQNNGQYNQQGQGQGGYGQNQQQYNQQQGANDPPF